jgi:hypothetical protein
LASPAPGALRRQRPAGKESSLGVHGTWRVPLKTLNFGAANDLYVVEGVR